MANSPEAAKILKAFGKRLYASRVGAGYNDAKDLAADLGLEAPRYRKYERGQSLPPVDILAEICKITGKSLDFLIFNKVH